jgi:hypothetical protein
MKNITLLAIIALLGWLPISAQTLTVNLGQDLLVCQDSCVTVGPTNGLVADGYLWNTGDTIRNLVFCLPAGFQDTTLILFAFDSLGNTGADTVVVNSVVCNDSIWPGDANNDGVCNVYDITRIGQGFGFSGLVRPNASTSWVGQPAYNWLGSAVLDYKYADCDGNGTIQYADFQVVQLNYGLTHQKDQLPMPRSTGNPTLRIYCDQDTLYAGDTITFHIDIADSQNPVVDFYAIAFNVAFDSTLFVANESFSDYSNNFIGQFGAIVHGFDTTLWQVSTLDLGFTKLDQTNITGHGNIANVSYILIDDIAGKTNGTFITADIQVFFTNVLAISADGTVIPLDVYGDTVVIKQEVVGIAETVAASSIKVYPMPAKDLVNVVVPSNVKVEAIEVYNGMGALIETDITNGLTSFSINVDNYVSGYYLLRIKTENGWVAKRFSIMK